MIPTDVERVCEIIGQHNKWDKEIAGPFFLREFKENIAGLRRSRHFVAEISGRVTGSSGWIESQICAHGIYWLGWTYVDEANRRQGIGQALLDHVETTVRGLGCRKIYLDTGATGYDTAIKFYERNGFVNETILPDYYSSGVACYVMAKTLTKALAQSIR